MSTTWCLVQLSIIIFVVHSCRPAVPSDGSLYVSNVELLDDPNYLLLTIVAYNDAKTSAYCKLFDVNDGTVSNVVSCTGFNIRTWSTGDVDATSTQIVSAQDNNDGTVDVTLKRNDATVGITGIPYLGTGGTSFYYDQFTLDSMHSTFVLMGPSQYNVEIVQITFASQSDNSSPKVTSFGLADSEWGSWKMGDAINMIPVYEDANAIQLPLVCCLCDYDFIARYYFTYDAMSGDISGIKIDTSVWGGKVDVVAQKAYDYGPFYPTSITVYDLKNIGGTSNEYELDLSYTTDSPSKPPTNEPSKTPTAPSSSPSNSPSNSPSKTPSKTPSNFPTNEPSKSPSNLATVSPTEGGSSNVDRGTTSESVIGGKGSVETDSDQTAEGFINNISKDSPWVIVIVCVLLLCIVGMVCFYCVHNRKLKNRISSLENQTQNGEFNKLEDKSPLPTDGDNTNNDLNPLNHQDSAFGNIDLRSNTIPNIGSNTDTNPVFINPGAAGDGLPNLNGNINNNIIINNNNNNNNYDDMDEGGLPLPPEPNQPDTIYNTPNGDDVGSHFSSSDDMMADNKITTNGEQYIVNVDNDDNHDDMYNDKNKTVVSIKVAKQLNVSDKEAYLNDDDFKNVFGITKDEFYKLKSWKQTALKKKHQFF